MVGSFESRVVDLGELLKEEHMLTEEVDAKVITREMVARQAAEEATTWVVEDGTYEATVSKYEEVPEDKLFDSERNAGVRAYNVDFQCYDVPGKASKVQNIRFQTGAVQNEWGIDAGFKLATSLIGIAEAYDATTVSGQLEQAFDWHVLTASRSVWAITSPRMKRS